MISIYLIFKHFCILLSFENRLFLKNLRRLTVVIYYNLFYIFFNYFTNYRFTSEIYIFNNDHNDHNNIKNKITIIIFNLSKAKTALHFNNIWSLNEFIKNLSLNIVLSVIPKEFTVLWICIRLKFKTRYKRKHKYSLKDMYHVINLEQQL